jgi:hypothetical protein
MAGQYDKMIKISITEAAQGVSILGFGTVLILTPDATFQARTKSYTAADSTLAADLTGGPSSNAYKAAEAIFAQNPAPTSIKVGRVAQYETLSDAVDAIRLEDDDWYLCICTDRDPNDVQPLAEHLETMTKLFIYASGDSDILDPNSTEDIAYLLKDLGLNRSAGIYKADYTTERADAALAGFLGAQDKPGSYTACYKKLVGQATDALTSAEEDAVLGDQQNDDQGKCCNTYQNVGGAGRFRYGVVASGKFIDYIIFKDWLKARLQEAIFGLFASVPKVPGDINGAAMIQNAMEPVFKLGQANNAITAFSQDEDKKQNGGYFINLPDMSLRSNSDKATRHLSGIKFGCWYTDGIHTVEIDGVIL